MSNYLAIATVTAALGHIVQQAAEASGVGSVGLDFGRPTATASGQAPRRVHIYLYQVSPNASLRNRDLPARGTDARWVGRPQAALDLRYVIAFYGSQQTLEPDRMLGAAVRNLHASPLLSRQTIQETIANHPELNISNLADAFERVRFTPVAMSLEELSKLWSVFFQTPHALSVVYDANVVLIEAEESGPSALPVLRRGDVDQGVDLLLGPFPTLKSACFGMPDDRIMMPRPLSLPAAQLGLSVILSGHNLGGETLLLRFHHPRLGLIQELPVASADCSATELKVLLPQPGSGNTQTEWAPGAYTVTAVERRLGSDQDRTSNSLPIPLSPVIANIAPPNPISIDGNRRAMITITCQPRVREAQQAVLLFADREVTGEIDVNNPDKVIFVVENASAVNNGLIRLRVDGIESMPFKRVDEPPPSRFEFDDSHRVTIT